MTSLMYSACAVVLGATLQVSSIAIGQEPADSLRAPAPSLHEFWQKATRNVQQTQNEAPYLLRRREADLASFHIATYQGRSDLPELFRASVAALLQMEPSIERSRLIRAWRDIAVSHTFRDHDKVFSQDVIDGDTCWANMLDEEKSDQDKPLTIGALRKSIRSFEESFKADGTYPLGKLVELLSGLSEGTNVLLVKNGKDDLTTAEHSDLLRLLNYRVVLEQVAFSILQRSQEGKIDVSVEPYPDEAALIGILARALSDHSATLLTRLHARLLEDVLTLRDFGNTARGIKLERKLEPVVVNAEPRTLAYLRIRTGLAEQWCQIVQSNFTAASALDIGTSQELTADILPSDRESALAAQSLIQAQLQFAILNYQDGLKTLAAAIPRCREANDSQLLDLLAMQAQAYSLLKSFGAAHASLDQAKRAFAALAPSERQIDRCRRANVLLAELIVLLNENRPRDAQPLLQTALRTAFATNYESGVHYAAAKCLIECGAPPGEVRFQLEQADDLMHGSTQAEHMEVLLELVKVLNALGEKKAANEKIVEYMQLRDRVQHLIRNTPAYWAQLFDLDFSAADASAIDLLMEAYLVDPNPETLQLLLWANDVCLSRGVQDGIKTSWMGFAMSLEAEVAPEVAALFNRLYPPIPEPEKIVEAVKLTIRVLDELTERKNTVIVYIHSVRLDKVVLVRCTAQEITAFALTDGLSAIESSIDKMILQQQTLLAGYQKLVASPNSQPQVQSVQRNEDEQRIHSEKLADMLLPKAFTKELTDASEEPGLTVVVGGPLRKASFLPLRIEKKEQRRYVRDSVASFSMAPSMHCVFLLLHYAIIQSEGLQKQNLDAGPRKLLLASDPNAKLPFEKQDREGVAGSFRGPIVTATTKQDLLKHFGTCDDLHIVSARRRACCGHGYPLDFSWRVTGGKALFSRAMGGVGW